ncbi:conserved Plasmodium protein, unknown function [Plasmodium ovale wallikeri]|uniref:Uncharacterized protein n=2 Tax=Plasmodium ovale TaxID=36330 RepID=A0A1A8YL43_PLAOA|nr:conserved Plasmodium protein, unknown function [Plasmodium ovale wallikeri]SBT32278.1 conserved Plasmodium protein, unknown function [Plasmodium ovale wallikeri]SBT75703.1 conserved Plasmodium protein, unknown function [Plasmodium ovale]
MAQNPWYIQKSKALRSSKLEKIINKFNEEYSHLMDIPKFRYIKRALESIFENPGLIINKKTFNVVRIGCIAQLQPMYLNRVEDGISVYLSQFMLKVNHDVEGFSISFSSIKLKEREPKTVNGDPSIMFLKISFKLLILVLKENYRIKVKINEIGPSYMHMDLFGMIEVIIMEELSKGFHYDSKRNIFVREDIIYSVNDIITFTIKKIAHADDGSNVKLIGYI